MGEGNVFSLFTSGGGYPYPIMLCNISQNAMAQLGGGTLPGPARGGYPVGGGVPWPGGYYVGGVPWPGGTLARGVPWLGGTLAGGYPAQGGYPGRGVPWPGGGTQLGQHREYLLHGGRYASCVHAGGLSCFIRSPNSNCVEVKNKVR